MRPPKYGNHRVEVDGIKFDSKKEARRYEQLKALARAGEIEGLELQPRFRIEVNGIKVCDYYGDFRYTDKRTGAVVTEDAKGFKTDVYKLKRTLVKAVHGVEIQEV